MLCICVTKKRVTPVGKQPLKHLRHKLSSAAYLRMFLFARFNVTQKATGVSKGICHLARHLSGTKKQQRHFHVCMDGSVQSQFSSTWTVHPMSHQLPSAGLCSAFPKRELLALPWSLHQVIPVSNAEGAGQRRKHQYPPVARKQAGRSWPEFLAEADVAQEA